MSGFLSLRRSWGVMAIVCASLCLALLAFHRTEQYPRAIAKVPEEPTLLLDTAVARTVSMGYGSFLASIAWVDVVFEYANTVFGNDGPSVLLPSMIRLVTVLDPRWAYPWEFGGLALEGPDGKATPDALAFLAGGVERFPRSWRMKVYLAMSLLGNGDVDGAGRALRPLITAPDSMPDHIRALAVTLAGKKSKESGLQILLEALQTTEDPLAIVQLSRKFEDLLKDDLAYLGSRKHSAVQALVYMARSSDSQQQSVAFGLVERLQNSDPGVRMALQDLADQWDARDPDAAP